MDKSDLRTIIIQSIEAERAELARISSNIHSNPEMGFEEEKASDWLTDFLKTREFRVMRGVGGLPTAFRAEYGKGSPVIAILAEYDALPKLGHACGHNIIATSAIGAAVGAKTAVKELGGTVVVMGTPGEEIYGGKAMMLAQNAFDGIEVAMMVHPSSIDSAVVNALACQGLNVEFFGKAAHAAGRPEAGINALEAMILSYNAINSLRQHIRETARIHGIITDGGEAANIVPEHTAANFIVRAQDDDYLTELKGKVLDCFVGAGVATGARLKYEWADVAYSPMLNNMALAHLFADNMQTMGRKMPFALRDRGFGSTDMGNVSQFFPSIHPQVSAVPPGVPAHSPAFRIAAGEELALKAMMDSAKAMALTVSDLLTNPEILAKIKEEFRLHKQAAVEK